MRDEEGQIRFVNFGNISTKQRKKMHEAMSDVETNGGMALVDIQRDEYGQFNPGDNIKHRPPIVGKPKQ